MSSGASNKYSEAYADESTALLLTQNVQINDMEDSFSSELLSPSSKNADKNNGISWYFAVFLIVNAALGAGMLNFGKAYDNAGGIIASSIMQLVIVIIIIGAFLILAFLTDKKNSANFQDVVYGQCGKVWQAINSVCIIFYMFGCCITFLIIIGDSIDQILTSVVSEHTLNEWYCDRKFTITLTSLIFILPLSYPKRIDFLTYPSLLAVLCSIYVIILIPIKWAQMDTSQVVTKTKPDNWTDVFTVIPVVCFGYQGHVNAVPIYTCLKNKSLWEFTKSIIASIILLFAAYQIVAIFGYLSFGVHINDDILKSYDTSDPSVLIAIIMFLIKTYTSYPLNLFCARTAIEGIWIEVFKLDNEAIINSEKKRRIIIVTLWYIISLLIAIFVPNITIVINYLGALAGAFMFLFPGLCLLFYSLDRANGNHNIQIESIEDEKKFNRTTNILLCLSVFYATFGTFVMALVVCQSFLNDLHIH